MTIRVRRIEAGAEISGTAAEITAAFRKAKRQIATETVKAEAPPARDARLEALARAANAGRSPTRTSASPESPIESGLILATTIPGEPIPKGRPRVVGRRAYTPARTRRAERDVGWALKLAMAEQRPVTGPVGVRLIFASPSPRGDLDNYVKLVLDAANGIVWADDRQVVWLEASVTDTTPASTFVQVWRDACVAVREG